MSKGPGIKAVFALLLIGAGGVGALAWYVKSDPFAAKVPANLRVPSSEPDVRITRPKRADTDADRSTPSEGPQTVMVPTFSDGKMASEMSTITVPDGQDSRVFLVDQVAKGVHVEARVLGVDFRNRTAVINFANGIDSGMGSEQEALFLAALQKAFSQFPDVDKLELDKEGQPLDSVGGHIDLSDGLPVTRNGPSDSAPPKPSEP